MNAIRTWMLVGSLTLVWVGSSGCVGHDEYLREKFARNKAVERAETLERDLADERNRVMALEAERESMRRELDAKTALSETLRSENERLAAFNQRLQEQVDDFAKRGIGDIKVVEVKLPAELDRALKEFAAKYPDEVEYDPQRGAVRWKSDLTFAKGSDEVRPNAMASLEAFADIVQSAAASAFEVIVVGHTDNLRIGPVTAKQHPTNWHLSAHRSIAVMNVLARNGIGQDRLGVMGYGEHRPAVPNPSAGGSETNRRVEIFLVAGHEDAPSDVTALGEES